MKKKGDKMIEVGMTLTTQSSYIQSISNDAYELDLLA